ncbi:hypothetical protein CesoFtcFv8_005210 [Champsocephalus esox]|uniref:Uncharacterized protein n=1 Tax=Champsocephalus esox TaxID=159716 RepID=A0AAN8CPA8_9TELE|nr:hypothetical protein CesoFtcFv8_005210 [Champsocephalus esox]
MRELTEQIDARKRMQADRGRALHRDKRTRYLAVIVVQNVLVTACLVVTLYLFWVVQNQEASEDNVHIQFNPITVSSGNRTAQFGKVKSSNMMSLADGKNDAIYIKCTGPYVLYMKVCYKSMDGTKTGGGHGAAGVGESCQLFLPAYFR